MDVQEINQIVGTFQALFGESEFNPEDTKHLSVIKALVKQATWQQKRDLADKLYAAPLPTDNVFPLSFFLFDLFDDVRFLNRLPSYLPDKVSPAYYYDLFWNLSNRSFVGRQSHTELSNKLRHYQSSCSASIKQFLSDYGLRARKKVIEIRTIAILSPQLLSMRHSPTREAYSLALHLQHYFGINVVIVNTNGMAYGNQLNLIETLDFHSNQHLSGLQSRTVNYLDFKQSPVNILTFAPEPMSTRKITNIIDSLGQLKVDAVIAHGENLLVQEAIFGVYPSIFATTGGVVPYAHSDAYFVPATLYAEPQQKLAEKYGHSDFLLESMLVTPEGEAEAPATRSTFGIAESAFVYLVVGTRLTNELNEEFIWICQQLLESSETAVLAFSGTNELSLNRYFDNALIDSQRVITLGFQNDLPAICKMCDVYLNPKRQGGGTSSQTAILNDLPIVTLNHGHISAVVPESFRQLDWSSYLEFAKRLHQEPGLLAICQQQLKQHFVENLSIKKQVAKLLNKLQHIAADKYQ